MDIQMFLDPSNDDYQIQVIAPTHTYGVMHSFDSSYDFDIQFDEYDPEGLWEFNIIINGKIVKTFNHIDDVKQYLQKTE